MSSKKKPAAPETVEYCPLTEDSDIAKAVKAFIQNCHSSRNFKAVKKNKAGTDVLTVEITTPK